VPSAATTSFRKNNCRMLFLIEGRAGKQAQYRPTQRMKTRCPRLAVLIFATGLALSCATSVIIGDERQNPDPIKVNLAALEHAKNLTQQGHVVVDKRNAWSEQQPSAEEENEFIRQHGFEEYAKWHLGIDDTHAENTKARYKFPYGDFENVHRSALLAVKGRARQYSYSNIENAAVQLLEMIHPEKKQATSAP
jgi:hypothetical protein